MQNSILYYACDISLSASFYSKILHKMIYLFDHCRERELQSVATLKTTYDYTGWLEFNLTEPLSMWVAFPESNKGLYLSVHAADKAGKIHNYVLSH